MKKIIAYLIILSSINAFGADQKKAQKLFAVAATDNDFHNLNITQDSSIGLKFFVKNLGLNLSADSAPYNALYTSINMQRWVFVQANMAVGDRKPGKITTLPNGNSYFSVSGSINFFVLAKGLNRTDVIKLEQNISKSIEDLSQATTNIEVSRSKLFTFIDELLRANTAYAAGVKCTSNQEVEKQLNSTSESEFTVIKNIAIGCANGGGAGTKDATWGVLNFGYDVVTKGSEQLLCKAAGVVDKLGTNLSWSRCDDYAKAMENSINSMMYATANVKQVAGQIVDGFSSLPAAAQAQVFCEMAGSAATGAVMTFATAGAGAPAALAQMSEILGRVAKMPGMGQSADTLKMMSLKVSEKAREKATALAAVKPVPTDLTTSLEKIKSLQNEYSSNASKLRSLQIKIDSNRSSQMGTQMNVQQVYMQNYSKMLSGRLLEPFSSEVENKAAANFLLKHAVLTDKQKALALEVANPKNVNEYGMISHKGDDVPILKLASSLMGREIKVKPEFDTSKARTEIGIQLKNEEKDLSEAAVAAKKAADKSHEKLQSELSRYWEVLDKKNLSEKDKALYRAQVSTYSTAVLCSTVNSVDSKMNNGSTTDKGGVQ